MPETSADLEQPAYLLHMESVDYVNTFIAVAPDFDDEATSVPPLRAGKPTVALATWQLIHGAPDALTSADVIFTVWADRHGIPTADRDQARRDFFAKPQACLRASDLGKRYGWGIHADDHGRLALYPVGSAEYGSYAAGGGSDIGHSVVAVKFAMRPRRRPSASDNESRDL